MIAHESKPYFYVKIVGARINSLYAHYPRRTDYNDISPKPAHQPTENIKPIFILCFATSIVYIKISDKLNYLAKFFF